MNRPEDLDEPGWSPATSRPGEVFTVEGRIKAVGAFARGLKNDDPRSIAARRPMIRVGMFLILAVVVATAIGIALS